MINKLRRRFILITMTSVTLVMLLLGLSINLINFISINSDMNHMLKIICDNRGSIPDFHTGQKPGVSREQKQPISPEAPYRTRYFVLHYSENGALISADMKHIAAVTENDLEFYLSAAVKREPGFGYCGSYKYYIAAAGGGRYTAVFLDWHEEMRFMRGFALITLLVMAVCIVLIFLLVLFFSKRAIDPVIRSTEKQKQFITDASHELKTPLTVITTSLKVLEMETGRQKWIDKAQTQADKMRDLVNGLVALSRLDEEKPSLKTADFDLSGAVEETAESFRDFSAAQGHTLEWDIAPDIFYHGDEYAVRQMVSILLDNAVKYADAGGICLRLERARRGVVLTVSNPCAGLAREDLDRLFDRFYRPDVSRSKQTGGFGIGLSIARGIAEAHKGSIRAECPAEGVVQFVAVLR